jgi:hypothetical protein
MLKYIHCNIYSLDLRWIQHKNLYQLIFFIYIKYPEYFKNMKDELRNNTWTVQLRIVPISLSVALLDLFLRFKK